MGHECNKIEHLLTTPETTAYKTQKLSATSGFSCFNMEPLVPVACRATAFDSFDTVTDTFSSTDTLSAHRAKS